MPEHTKFSFIRTIKEAKWSFHLWTHMNVWLEPSKEISGLLSLETSKQVSKQIPYVPLCLFFPNPGPDWFSWDNYLWVNLLYYDCFDVSCVFPNVAYLIVTFCPKCGECPVIIYIWHWYFWKIIATKMVIYQYTVVIFVLTINKNKWLSMTYPPVLWSGKYDLKHRFKRYFDWDNWPIRQRQKRN